VGGWVHTSELATRRTILTSGLGWLTARITALAVPALLIARDLIGRGRGRRGRRRDRHGVGIQLCVVRIVRVVERRRRRRR
jgi:hypothetical protein